MKSIIKLFFYAFILMAVSTYSAPAQGLLKKLGNRMGNEAEKLLDKDSNSSGNQDNNQNQNTSSDQSSGVSSTGMPNIQTSTSSTGRKKMTPPDVKKSIADAQTAYGTKNFDETRYDVQQALVGIELEIGYQILNSLPKNVNDHDYKDEDDQVVSSGWGWSGFDVERSYYAKDDRMVDINITNNQALSAGINAYLTNPMYAGSNENQKAVKVGDYRAVLMADEDGGFTLSIPLGQSSLIMINCKDCADENAVSDTALKFDIAGIKTMLGEQ
jgi:hypothetical protein